MYAQHPLTVTIDPRNFLVPLSSPDLLNIQIGKAVVDTGKMQFSNTGELQKLLGLLKQSSKDNEISIWATPIYLSMQKGVLSLYRTDMLIMQHYPIAAWGQLNFAKDNVNMVVGITGQALSHSLGISGIDKDEMLQIPIKGKIRNAKIDQSQAAARIATIIAKSNAGGTILGTVLDLANGKQDQIPEPTTQPFPWGDIQPPSRSQYVDEGEAPAKKKNKNSLKEVERGAAKLLNKILG